MAQSTLGHQPLVTHVHHFRTSEAIRALKGKDNTLGMTILAATGISPTRFAFYAGDTKLKLITMCRRSSDFMTPYLVQECEKIGLSLTSDGTSRSDRDARSLLLLNVPISLVDGGTPKGIAESLTGDPKNSPLKITESYVSPYDKTKQKVTHVKITLLTKTHKSLVLERGIHFGYKHIHPEFIKHCRYMGTTQCPKCLEINPTHIQMKKQCPGPRRCIKCSKEHSHAECPKPDTYRYCFLCKSTGHSPVSNTCPQKKEHLITTINPAQAHFTSAPLPTANAWGLRPKTPTPPTTTPLTTTSPPPPTNTPTEFPPLAQPQTSLLLPSPKPALLPTPPAPLPSAPLPSAPASSEDERPSYADCLRMALYADHWHDTFLQLQAYYGYKNPRPIPPPLRSRYTPFVPQSSTPPPQPFSAPAPTPAPSTNTASSMTLRSKTSTNTTTTDKQTKAPIKSVKKKVTKKTTTHHKTRKEKSPAPEDTTSDSEVEVTDTTIIHSTNHKNITQTYNVDTDNKFQSLSSDEP